jgi:hypothetical protein
MNRTPLVAILLFAAVAHAKPPAAPKVIKRGAPISKGEAVSLERVLAEPDASAGKTVIVDGTVRAACAKKGCWMELAASEKKDAPACRVRFKDYGFFVPTDSAGASARVEGEVQVRTIPTAEVAHYESEGGKFPNKGADGSARVVELMATGVELRR